MRVIICIKHYWGIKDKNWEPGTRFSKIKFGFSGRFGEKPDRSKFIVKWEETYWKEYTYTTLLKHVVVKGTKEMGQWLARKRERNKNSLCWGKGSRRRWKIWCMMKWDSMLVVVVVGVCTNSQELRKQGLQLRIRLGAEVLNVSEVSEWYETVMYERSILKCMYIKE